MKTLKKFVIPLFLLTVVGTTIIIVLSVDFEALLIDVIERMSRVDVSYENMNGNILRGYHIDNYCVRFSETDSVYGPTAEIKYRFIPSLLRLPNLFEITLIQPVVSIQEQKSETYKQRSPFSIPRLSVGIRINLKNGTVNYVSDKTHTFNKISGLVFIDLIGSIIYLNTMNLSVQSTSLPVDITSANLNVRISNETIEARSIRIKGSGFSIKGAGIYSFDDNTATMNINKGIMDLARLEIYKGSIDFTGEIQFRDQRLYPNIKGFAHGLDPIEQCEFETNVFGDTIFVNLFNGDLFDGTIFAQAKVVHNELYEIETNFNELDISRFLSIDKPVLVHGYGAYRDGDFIGFVSSPTENGFGIDSLFLHGNLKGDTINLDSLFIEEQGRVVSAQGRVLPSCDLEIDFNNFVIDRFVKFTPFTDTSFKGTLHGACHLVCAGRTIDSMQISGSFQGENMVLGDLHVQTFSIASQDFRLNDQANSLRCDLIQASLQNTTVDSLSLTMNDRAYDIFVQKAMSYIKAQGTLEDELTGIITDLMVKYHDVEIQSNTPITFDIPNKTISDFDFTFADGTLHGSLDPPALELSGADLMQISKLLGLRDTITGSIDLHIRRNRIFCTAHSVDFIGLCEGTLQCKGDIIEGGIAIQELIIKDSTQSVTAQAILSKEFSEIHTSFSNVGVWVLPFLTDFMVEPKGYMTGELGLSGTPEDYSFDGLVTLEQGSFGIEPIDAFFDSVQGEVRFEGKRIVFKTGQGKIHRMTHFSVKQTQQSIVYTGGLINLGPHFKIVSFHYDFSFKDAPVQFMPFAYGTGSGNVSMGMKDDTTYYKGAITIKQAIVPLEFGQVIEEDTATVDDNWTMNIRIKGDRNIWLRNRDADIEMGGELFLIKEHGPMYLTGVLNTRRGNYYWLNHTLSITEGRLIFLPQEVVDAELDIWAKMDTRDRDPTTGTPITIKLHMFGTISEPIFEFFSDPPYYTEQDIVMYLNLNITWSELESMKRGDFVQTVLPQSLVSWLESDVSRRIRLYTGLDYFRIETPFFEDENRTRLTVGKYISRKLFITYTYDITSFENQFNVEYFIDDKNEILIRRDEEGEYSVQYQYRIRF